MGFELTSSPNTPMATDQVESQEIESLENASGYSNWIEKDLEIRFANEIGRESAVRNDI